MAANTRESNSGDERMKKADVKIGGEYFAKVTGRKVVVRIEVENPHGGWDATNMSTRKKVRIKSAARLQGPTRGEGPADEATETGPGKSARRKPAGGDAATPADGAKLSCIKAALKVLQERGEPMNTQEMVTAMAEAGYWESPGGKTPHATLYSSILRELKKGDESRFIKTERGRFTVRA